MSQQIQIPESVAKTLGLCTDFVLKDLIQQNASRMDSTSFFLDSDYIVGSSYHKLGSMRIV